MNFKWILITLKSQSEKTTYFLITIIWHSGKGKPIEITTGQLLVGVWSGGLIDKAQGISEWNYFGWYCNGGTFCQNTQNFLVLSQPNVHTHTHKNHLGVQESQDKI